MSETHDDQAATYDVEAVQAKWQPVWEQARALPCRRRGRPLRRAREALRADDVPLPER